MDNTNYKNGMIYALTCTVIWGFLPIYWDALSPISSLVVIFYRIVLMTLSCLAIQLYQTRSIKAVFAPMVEDRKKLRTYIIAGVLITANWSIYIWAVQAGFVIQASMGYFLEPLLTLGLIQYIAPSIALVLGIFLFREPFDIIQFTAFAIIWVGLVFFTCGEVSDVRSRNKS